MEYPLSLYTDILEYRTKRARERVVELHDTNHLYSERTKNIKYDYAKKFAQMSVAFFKPDYLAVDEVLDWWEDELFDEDELRRHEFLKAFAGHGFLSVEAVETFDEAAKNFPKSIDVAFQQEGGVKLDEIATVEPKLQRLIIRNIGYTVVSKEIEQLSWNQNWLNSTRRL